MSKCQEHYYVQRVMQIAQQHRCVLPSDLKRLFFVESDDSDPFDEKKVDHKTLGQYRFLNQPQTVIKQQLQMLFRPHGSSCWNCCETTGGPADAAADDNPDSQPAYWWVEAETVFINGENC